jgi:hypothetical protein
LNVNPILAVLGWFATMLALSLGYRYFRGKPIWFVSLNSPVYVERGASGFADQPWFRRLFSVARHCLVVGVTTEHLVVRLSFPFNLFFFSELSGLEIELPLHQVKEIEPFRSVVGRGARIRFTDTRGRSRSLTVYLRDPEALSAAVLSCEAGVCDQQATG